MASSRVWLYAFGVLILGAFGAEPAAEAVNGTDRLPPGPAAWSDSARGMIRGVTIGPIESQLHPGRGYGSEPFERTLLEAKRLGSPDAAA